VAEIQHSTALLDTLLGAGRPGAWYQIFLPGEGIPLSGIGLAEGWRGTIAHRVELGADGRLTRWKIVDPSFLTWPALPLALADTIVPDFPLVNKSFNLSYAGNDL
jgi:Ni,Fe-hydrogenase III large subunit